jgi:ferredoxin--NADP+ reductase
MPAKLNSVLTERRDIAPGLSVFRVAPDGWDIREFKAGQYVVLGLPGIAPRCAESDAEEKPCPPDKLIRRAYSIASSSIEREYLEFYVVLVESGALTPRLFGLELGDRLWLGKKITGTFTLDRVPDGQHLVLIATGTGLAPYISMLRSRLLHARAGKVAVLHGARHSWDLGYRNELALVERDHTNFTYVPSITRPSGEKTPWHGEVGRMQEIWLRDPLHERWGFSPSPDDTHILMCGNPAMIDTLIEILTEEGYQEHTRKSPGNIHLERYW